MGFIMSCVAASKFLTLATFAAYSCSYVVSTPSPSQFVSKQIGQYCDGQIFVFVPLPGICVCAGVLPTMLSLIYTPYRAHVAFQRPSLRLSISYKYKSQTHTYTFNLKDDHFQTLATCQANYGDVIQQVWPWKHHNLFGQAIIPGLISVLCHRAFSGHPWHLRNMDR